MIQLQFRAVNNSDKNLRLVWMALLSLPKTELFVEGESVPSTISKINPFLREYLAPAL